MTARAKKKPCRLERIAPGVRLFCGDSEQMRFDSTWAIITDPPYGINYRSRHNTGPKGWRKAFCRDTNFQPIHGDEQPFDPTSWLRFPYVAMFGPEHFYDRLPAGGRFLVWNKLCGKTPSRQADGELIWTNTPGKTRILDHLWRGIMRAGEENISRSAKVHPNQKPLSVMERIIHACRIPPGTTILDPYMGSGSTGIAAVRLGYPFVGVEIDETHFDVAVERIRHETRQITLPLSGMEI